MSAMLAPGEIPLHCELNEHNECEMDYYVDKFIADQGTSFTTRQKYRENIVRFIDFCKATGENTRHITPADIFRYREYLIKQELSPNTVYAYLSPLKLFFSWMYEQDFMKVNITANLTIPKRGNIYCRGHLNIDQVRHLLSTMPRGTVIDERNYAMVTLMLQAGLRCVEISRLNIENFREENGIFFIQITRKGKVYHERLGINQLMFEQFAYYLESRDDNYSEKSPAFVTHQRKRNARLTPLRVGRIVNGILMQAGLKITTGNPISAHSLRHTCATLALDIGIDVYDIRILLGHSSVKITEMYQRSRDAERLLENPVLNRISALLFNGTESDKNPKKTLSKQTERDQKGSLS